jgi:hypothetical protein
MEKQRNDLAVLQKNGLIHLIGKSENRIPENLKVVLYHGLTTQNY